MASETSSYRKIPVLNFSIESHGTIITIMPYDSIFIYNNIYTGFLFAPFSYFSQ